MKIETEGIMKYGYGIVPKAIMRDRQLSIEAKAIYAYLAAYSNAAGEAFPPVEQVCDDLNISRQRLKKHREDLEARGYLTTFRKRKEVGFTNNIYRLNMIVKKKKPQHDSIYRLYKQHELLPPSPETNDALHKWIEKVGADIVSLAIKRTAEYSRFWNYTKSILEDWEQKGLTTVEEVKEEIKRSKATYGRKNNTYSNRREERLPSWWQEAKEETSQPNMTKEEIDQLRNELMEELGTKPKE